MRRVIRENGLCAAIALLGSGALAWLGLYGFAWNDYDNEARQSFEALVHGHLEQFLRLAPAYGGSLVERAPFALLPGLWSGGQLAVYRAVAAPCLLAAALLGVWLLNTMRRERRPPIARAITLALCVANPVTLSALEVGHPEELLGACLCVCAVLLAGEQRALGAGLALGLAIANKEWAVLAAGPVLLALPARRRAPCLGVAAITAVGVLAPLLLVGSGGFSAATRASASAASAVFQPWQLWWFLGHHGALVHGAFGAPKPGYRIGPAWIASLDHRLVVATGLALAVATWLRFRRERDRLSVRRALLALALIMLLRAMLDTWDTAYYMLPFLFALLAWEIRGARVHPPVLALCSTIAVWLTFTALPEHVSPDVQSAVFLAWSLPLALALALVLLAPRRAAAIAARRRSAGAKAHEMTVKSFARPLRTS